MKSHASSEFRLLFNGLPTETQRQARRAYALWRNDNAHPSLQFKRIQGSDPPLYSVRVGLHWRALGVRDGDEAYAVVPWRGSSVHHQDTKAAFGGITKAKGGQNAPWPLRAMVSWW